MSKEIKVYEAGVRNELTGKYSQFITSRVRAEVDDYIDIMKQTVSTDYEIVFYERFYNLISTTPYIINR
jgi:hypothetical protein